MGALDDLKKKIAAAKASVGGNNITDGNYVFLVEKIELEKKESGHCFIVELYVKESTDVPVSPAQANGPSEARPLEPAEDVSKARANKAGSDTHYVVNLDSNKSAPGNAKAFLLALFGEDEDNVTDEDFLASLDEAIDKSQPCRGMTIGAQTYRKKTKGGPNAGKWGCYPRWQMMPNEPDQVASGIAFLNARKGREGKAAL